MVKKKTNNRGEDQEHAKAAVEEKDGQGGEEQEVEAEEDRPQNVSTRPLH